MIREYKTISGCARLWVSEFNAIPTEMIAKLIQADPDSWHETTLPVVGDSVSVFSLPEGAGDFGDRAEIVAADYEKDSYTLENGDGKKITVSADCFDIERDDFLPMWGTMWSFSDPCDIDWPDGRGGLEALSRCGFRVYTSDDFGDFFGIDGAGYDFYSSHWIPLYKERGLKWHDVED